MATNFCKVGTMLPVIGTSKHKNKSLLFLLMTISVLEVHKLHKSSASGSMIHTRLPVYQELGVLWFFFCASTLGFSQTGTINFRDHSLIFSSPSLQRLSSISCLTLCTDYIFRQCYFQTFLIQGPHVVCQLQFLSQHVPKLTMIVH